MFRRASYPVIICFFGCLVLASCHQSTEVPPVEPPTVNAPKSTVKRLVSNALRLSRPDTLPFLSTEPRLMDAMLWQEDYLRRNSTPNNPAQGFSKKEMLETVLTLRSLPFHDFKALAEHFDFYQLNTDLKSDKVRVTGYYTPIMAASKVRRPPFVFPLLRKPGGPNAKVDSLDSSQGYALAWVRTLKELKNAQLQGSCLVEFSNGEQQFLGFGGSTPMNGSKYVYFHKVGDRVLGAGSFPMTAGYSLAVDPRCVPLGSTLLAELPDMDKSGNIRGYTYRIVLAQDRGGAIKTSKRVDLYTGIGKKGLKAAQQINNYGRLWVVLPKR